MERIRRNDYIAQVSNLLGKGEAVVLTGHRRAGKSCILELLAAALSAFRFDLVACALVLVYVLINIAYSAGLKNVPLLDVAILVSGFLIRIIYGAVLTEIPVSNWLYLTVISISFFFADEQANVLVV